MALSVQHVLKMYLIIIYSNNKVSTLLNTFILSYGHCGMFYYNIELDFQLSVNILAIIRKYPINTSTAAVPTKTSDFTIRHSSKPTDTRRRIVGSR